MFPIVRNEILKTFLKWRSYIGFIAIAVFVPLVEIGLKLEGGSMVKMMTRGLARDFMLLGNLFNGYFVTYFIMNSLWVHVPFLITLVAGDQLAGEATAGTFRLILTRPPSRSRILLAKYSTTLFHTALLVLFLALLSVGLGVALFGTGDLIVPGRKLVVMPEADVPLRLVLAFALAIWSMWCVASLAFFLSSLVENAIGPIVAAMAVIIVFIIISNIPVSLFTSIKPYLFTTYTNVWQHAMETPIPWDTILQSVLALFGFNLGFALLTWVIFVRKDILS